MKNRKVPISIANNLFVLNFLEILQIRKLAKKTQVKDQSSKFKLRLNRNPFPNRKIFTYNKKLKVNEGYFASVNLET